LVLNVAGASVRPGSEFARLTERHHTAVQRIGREVITPPPIENALTAASARQPEAAVRRSEAAWARRQARFEEAVRLHATGASLSAISRQIGADRKTLRHWFQTGTVPAWHQPRRGSLLDPYRVYLQRRWAEGCRNAARLWRELAEQGFAGRPATVRSWAIAQRRAAPDAAGLLVTASGQRWRPPLGRRVARLLMADASTLPSLERTFVARLLDTVPKLAAVIAAAKQLALLLRRRSQEDFSTVLAVAGGTPLASFAAERRKDTGAVQAALDLPWTTSPVEGQISRGKTIKRTMYGRAGFDLLRARVLQAG